MTIKSVVVTGGSGGVGQYVVRDLLEHGYEVVNLDMGYGQSRFQARPENSTTPFRRVDLTDYGQAFAAMQGTDAVVHLAANPEPDFDFYTGAERFRNNTLSTYNVFQAAVALGMQRVVWASSETVLGFPFVNVAPKRVPVRDEDPPIPQNSYALSKYVCEKLAEQMNTLYGIPFIGLRLSNVHFPGTSNPTNYEAIPGYWSDPLVRKFNLWGYIDARDAAQSARLALEAPITTAETFIISAVDTIMNWPTAELMAAVFPDVPIDEGTGEFETLLNIEKAQNMLGFDPQYTWRNVLGME